MSLIVTSPLRGWVSALDGVPDPVFESALGSMSGHNAITILTGNPVRTTGFFRPSV